MSGHAAGPFDVKLTPQPADNQVGDPTIGRMALDKQFHGDLEATSKGQMLSTMGDVKGSAGYVAIERVSGTLHGRKGTFALQHNATMTRGVPALNIIVVPDSGTAELVGLVGRWTSVSSRASTPTISPTHSPRSHSYPRGAGTLACPPESQLRPTSPFVPAAT